MTVDRAIYLGPAFIGYPQDVVNDVVEKLWLCSSARCPDFNHGSSAAGGERRKRLPDESKFCPTCGSESICEDIVTGQKKEQTPDYGTMADALSEAGFGEDYLWVHQETYDGKAVVLYLHNGVPKANRDFSMDPETPRYVPGTKIDKGDDLEWFAARFDGYYKVLQDCYGKDNVSLTWGLFNLIW